MQRVSRNMCPETSCPLYSFARPPFQLCIASFQASSRPSANPLAAAPGDCKNDWASKSPCLSALIVVRIWQYSNGTLSNTPFACPPTRPSKPGTPEPTVPTSRQYHLFCTRNERFVPVGNGTIITHSAPVAAPTRSNNPGPKNQEVNDAQTRVASVILQNQSFVVRGVCEPLELNSVSATVHTTQSIKTVKNSRMGPSVP